MSKRVFMAAPIGFPGLRRRLQFRLTTLIGVTALIAFAAGIYGMGIREVERQEETFRQIAAKGGLVHIYCYGTSVYFEQPPIDMCMNGIQRVIEPTGPLGQFSDADGRLFDGIIRLHYVHFAGSAVTQDGLTAFNRTHARCRPSTRPFSYYR